MSGLFGFNFKHSVSFTDFFCVNNSCCLKTSFTKLSYFKVIFLMHWMFPFSENFHLERWELNFAKYLLLVTNQCVSQSVMFCSLSIVSLLPGCVCLMSRAKLVSGDMKDTLVDVTLKFPANGGLIFTFVCRDCRCILI